MKIFTPDIIKKLALTASCFAAFGAHAATYTAMASGNFNLATTWQGGLVPGNSITSDVIIIPSGITVTLTQDLTVSNTANLIVNGTLSGATGNDLILSSGFLSGSGAITVDSLDFNLTTGFTYSGAITANRVATSGAVLSNAATININDALYLKAGSLDIQSGTVKIASNAWIIFSGGDAILNSTNFNYLGTVNIRYRGNTNLNADEELTLAALKDIEVVVANGASVYLSTDMNVRGNLMLTQGILSLNNHDLNFHTDGYLGIGGAGFVSGAANSSISVMSTNSSMSALSFTAADNTIKDMTINMVNSSETFQIGTDMNISGTLKLQSGQLVMNNHDLTLAVSGSVSGGSANSYIVTGQSGSVIMPVNGGITQVFSVGTATNYAPIVVTSNTGAANANIGVAVAPNVYVNSVSGEQVNNSQPVVNATWYVTSTASANIDMNLEMMWGTDMEVNGFNRSKAYVSHYTNSKWDVKASTGATVVSSNMFSLKRNNIKSLSPFAVLDERAVTTGVSNVVIANSFIIYPNPATNKLNLLLPANAMPATGTIHDVSGRIVKMFGADSNATSVSIDELPAGTYNLKLAGENFNAAQQFVKQ